MTGTNGFRVLSRGAREIFITREFQAPRRLVFDAITQPELMKQWFHGPEGWQLDVCTIDLEVGGSYRYEWSGPDGMRMAMSGIYREVRSPERIVNNERFEFGCEPQAGEQVGTLVLREQGRKTTMEITVVYPTQAARNAALASGMEHGMEAGYQRLDRMVETHTVALETHTGAPEARPR